MASFHDEHFSPRFIALLRSMMKAWLAPLSLLCLAGIAWSINLASRPGPDQFLPRIMPRLYPCEGLGGTVYAVSWSPTSELLAAASWEEGRVILRNATLDQEFPLEIPEALAKYSDGEARARDLAWAPDGKRLAISHGESVLVWDLAAGRVDRVLTGHSHPVITLAFTPDGRGLRSGDTQGIVFFWDLETGASRSLAASVNMEARGIGAAWFSPDGGTIVATAPLGALLLLDAESGKVRARINRPNQLVLCVAFTRDSRLIAVGSTEARIDVFNVADGSPRASWALPISNANALAFTADGQRLAVASGSDGPVTIWDVARRERILELEGVGRTRGLSFTTDGAYLVGGGARAKIAVWAIPRVPRSTR